MRPRLLLAVHSAKPGGAQLVALAQARALARDFDLLVAIEDGPLRAAFAQLGTVVDGTPRLPVWGATRRRWALQSARAVPDAVRLARLIHRHEVAAVLTNSSIVVAPVLAARLARVPVLAQVQEGPALPGAGSLLWLQTRLADTVVVISPSMAGAAANARARIVTNPVGIPIPPAPARAPRDPAGPFRILMVAAIDRNKSQHDAVGALAHVVDAGVDATLSLAGPEADATYSREVRATAAELGVSDRVRWLGPHDDVPALLLDADALVVASRAELTPLVLMEAMAHGTPVVATDVGGIPDIVCDGRTGLLVAPGQPRALGAALQQLAMDPVRAARLAEHGRRHIERNYDERGAHARLHSEVMRLLAAGARPGRRSGANSAA